MKQDRYLTDEDWLWWFSISEEWREHLLVAVECDYVWYEYDDTTAIVHKKEVDFKDKSL